MVSIYTCFKLISVNLVFIVEKPDLNDCSMFLDLEKKS